MLLFEKKPEDIVNITVTEMKIWIDIVDDNDYVVVSKAENMALLRKNVKLTPRQHLDMTIGMAWKLNVLETMMIDLGTQTQIN